MTKPQHAAIYVRISDDKAGDAAGVARQEDDARALAGRLGWGVGPVIIENDVSAYKRRKVTLPNGRQELRVVRPGFRNLLDLVMVGEVDGLVAYDLDRTARDPRDLEDLIDAVEQRVPRLPVESVTGSLRLANDSDVTMARVMVAIANKSSRDSSRRIKRKHDELAGQGKYAGGGPRRFGYEPDCITINPREAETLRWAAKQVLDGMTVSTLCRHLDRRGVPPVKAVRWDPKPLTDILRSPRIAGLRVHRGEVVGKAAWPAIIDMETHEALTAELHRRSRGHKQPTLMRWCNQLLFCGKCGRKLAGSYISDKRPYRYWCATSRGGCGRLAIHGPKLEAEIERQVLGYLTRPDVVEHLASTRSSAGAARARAAMAEDELQLRQLSRMWAEKQITLDEYSEARKIIEKRLRDARAVTMAAIPEKVRSVLAAGDITEAWTHLDPHGKRDTARTLLEANGYVGWTVKPNMMQRPAFDPRRLVLRSLSEAEPEVVA